MISLLIEGVCISRACMYNGKKRKKKRQGVMIKVNKTDSARKRVSKPTQVML